MAWLQQRNLMAQTKSIYIYGASGHGKVARDIAIACGYENVIFLDDNSELKFNENLPKFDIIIAIGDNKTRLNLQQKVSDFGFDVVNLIHPSAVISPSVTMQKGIVVMPNVVINADARIGNGVILNTACVVEHECDIGDFSHLSPNVSLAGGVKVGELSHIGIGSSIIQKINIGKNTTIGAGSVVVRNIGDNVVAFGVPARVMKDKK